MSRAPSENSEARTTGRWWGRYCSFVGHGMHRVSPPASCVWFALFRNTTRDGVVQIGIDRIMQITNLSDRYVREKLRELVDARLIRVESHGRRHVGVSRYRLLKIPRDEQVASVPLPPAPRASIEAYENATPGAADAEGD